MNTHAPKTVILIVFGLLSGWSSITSADTYRVDPVHSFALFSVHHLNAGNVWGRFNEPTGEFTLDPSDPTKDTFHVELNVAKLDTANSRRDSDLKGADWFSARQFPAISFKSTSAKKGEGNLLEVTGDLTIRGVTKSVIVPVEITGTAGNRGGIQATATIKRGDFGLKAMPGGVGEEVKLIVALEGTKR